MQDGYKEDEADAHDNHIYLQVVIIGQGVSVDPSFWEQTRRVSCPNPTHRLDHDAGG